MISDIDNSRLDKFQACPQLYDYAYNHEVGNVGLKFKADFSTYMIHLPVQKWFAAGGEYYPDWMSLVAAWKPSTEEMLKDKFGCYTAARAQRLFEEFVEKASNRGDLEEYKYIEHEQYRTRDIGLVNVKWGSKTDILLWHKATQQRHIWEIKASRWDYILTGIGFNRQVLGEIYVNNAAKGIVLFFNLGAKKNEDGVLFIEIEPTEDELELWRKQTCHEVMELETSRANSVWPRRTSACRRFNETCEFLDICDRGGSATPEGKAMIEKLPKHDSLKYLTSDE